MIRSPLQYGSEICRSVLFEVNMNIDEPSGLSDTLDRIFHKTQLFEYIWGS